MKNRRKFLKNSLIAAGAVTLADPLMGAVPGKKKEIQTGFRVSFTPKTRE